MIDPFDPRYWPEDDGVHTITMGWSADWVVHVSAIDYEFIRAFGSWHLKPDRNTCYAVCHHRIDGVKRQFYMHRVIMLNSGIQPPTAMQRVVDHRDGDGLNNTRENLRWYTIGDNAKNIYGYQRNLDLFLEVKNVRSRTKDFKTR